MTSAWREPPAWVGNLFERIEPLRIISRHLLLFLIVAASIFGLAIAAYFVMPASYVAVGAVQVGAEEPGVAQNVPGDSQKVGDPADMESQLIVVRSQKVIRRALASPQAQKALGAECAAAGGAGFDGKCSDLANRMDKLVDYVSTRYGVAAVGRSRILNISYTSKDPQIARDMANALITAFLEDQRDTVTASRRTAADWLNREGGTLDAEIRKLDDQIAKYRAAKGLVRGVGGPVNSERLSGISQQLSAAQATLATAAARLKEIRDANSGGSANATVVLESRTVGDLKQSIADVNAQMANAEATLGPAHPRRRALSDQLRTMNSQLTTEVERLTQNARKQYDAASERVALITSQLEAAKNDVATSIAGEGDIENLVREVEIKRRQYSDLAARANVLEVEQRVLSGSVRLVSPAEAPIKPFFPKLVPFAAAGMTLGLLLGFAAAFLAEKLAQGNAVMAAPRDDREDYADSVVQSLPPQRYEPQPQARSNAPLPRSRGQREAVQLLAMVPYVPAGNASVYGGHPLLSSLDTAASDPSMREAMDKLGWAVAGDTSSVPSRRIVLFTSPSSGSGKTLTVMAFARQMAEAGSDVLVVECNRVRPLISDAFGMPTAFGWGTTDVASLVVRSPFDGLDIIPSGHASRLMPPDYWEHRLDEMLDWAAGRYGLILLDGPSGETMDALRLANHADLVVMCARDDELDSEAMVGMIADISAVRPVKIGIAVTMVDYGRRAEEERPFVASRAAR